MDQPSIDQFFQSLVPTVSDDATVITDGLVALLDKIGPAIVVTHSQSGLFGWLLAIRRPSLLKAVISYEPGFVFPTGELPPPIPLYTGAMVAGNVVTRAQFANLTRMPLQVVYGDNIPTQPIPDLVADGRRAQVVASKLFETAVERASGEVGGTAPTRRGALRQLALRLLRPEQHRRCRAAISIPQEIRSRPAREREALSGPRLAVTSDPTSRPLSSGCHDGAQRPRSTRACALR